MSFAYNKKKMWFQYNGITLNAELRMTLFCLFDYLTQLNESRHDKTNKVSMRPAKTQITPGIRPV